MTTIPELAKDILEARAGFLRTADVTEETPPGIERGAPAGRASALTVLCAKIAEKSQPVNRFRNEVLHETLIPFEDIEPWIRERDAESQKPTMGKGF